MTFCQIFEKELVFSENNSKFSSYFFYFVFLCKFNHKFDITFNKGF